MLNLKKLNKSDFGKSIIPEKILKFRYKYLLENLYQKLYFDNFNYNIITNIFALSIISSIFLFFYLYDFIYRWLNDYFYQFSTKFLVIFASFFSINLFSYYFLLFAYFFIQESRFKKAEQEIEIDLPDFLDNLVSNLKGGISLEKALLKSVRPEQKALVAEVTLINQKIMMGKTVFQALQEFRARFDSQIIHRTIFLIEEGIKNGGNIAAPLERISENLKRIYNLNDEIKANAGGFSTVIKAITIFVAPLLFALALTLLTFIGNIFTLFAESGGATGISVSPIPNEFSDYLIVFSYSMIVMITFFSSLITAELKNEKIHQSIRYLPIYIILSILIFKIFSKVLLSFFGDIL